MIVKSVHTPIIDFMCVSEKFQRISHIINNADIDDCDVNENYHNCCLVATSMGDHFWHHCISEFFSGFVFDIHYTFCSVYDSMFV